MRNKLLGFTLLEVLMGLFLLAFSLLALKSIEVSAARKARANQYYQRALLLTKNMQYYLQSHHGEYSQYQPSWQKQINNLLPAANGMVIADKDTYQIKIVWGGMRIDDCSGMVNGVKGCLLVNYHLVE
jgi:Tfp pilus assembly protein PilV